MVLLSSFITVLPWVSWRVFACLDAIVKNARRESDYLLGNEPSG
jgi:hypothetical protein